MIVRTWAARVPVRHPAGFRDHLVRTGVDDYRRQSGYVDVDGGHEQPELGTEIIVRTAGRP